MKKLLYSLLLLCYALPVLAEDGYRLWLRYDKISNPTLLSAYQSQVTAVYAEGNSDILNAAKEELTHGFSGLLDRKITVTSALTDNSIVIGTPQSSPLIASLQLSQLEQLSSEGFTIFSRKIKEKNCIIIAANTDAGVLYGSFHLLQLAQTQQKIINLSVISSPRIQLRILNHWDNLTRTVETGRADWNPVYYHRADTAGIGFNRTEKGSNALEQYAPEVRKIYQDPATCPEEYLLWFHHISWKQPLTSGKTLWEELCAKYYGGVEEIRSMQKNWELLKGKVDEERFAHVHMLLAAQEKEAVWWRNACLLYFSTFSKMPIPAGYEQPDQTLDHYKAIRVLNAPGNGGGN